MRGMANPMRKVLNIGVNALKRRNLPVMLNKVALRLREGPRRRNEACKVKEWCAQNSIPAEGWAARCDPRLWEEAQQAAEQIHKNAQKKLSELNLDLGGGGHYTLLYFLTRYLRAGTVVETGVAAGWSSQAIMAALKENGQGGRLYSSDFPYFRYKNPEALVGYIVDDAFKESWPLYIEGDRYNLPAIVARCGEIDLFHYDSDKSYEGRVFAMDQVETKLAGDAIIVVDDIQDNFHFRDYVRRQSWPYKVFSFEGKFLGLTGPGMKDMDQVKGESNDGSEI